MDKDAICPETLCTESKWGRVGFKIIKGEYEYLLITFKGIGRDGNPFSGDSKVIYPKDGISLEETLNVIKSLVDSKLIELVQENLTGVEVEDILSESITALGYDPITSGRMTSQSEG